MKTTNIEFIKMLKTDTEGVERSKVYTEISGSEFKAFIEKMSAYQRSFGSRRKYAASHSAIVWDMDVELSRDERLKDVVTGIYYEINDIDRPMNHHQEIELAEVTN